VVLFSFELCILPLEITHHECQVWSVMCACHDGQKGYWHDKDNKRHE